MSTILPRSRTRASRTSRNMRMTRRHITTSIGPRYITPEARQLVSMKRRTSITVLLTRTMPPCRNIIPITPTRF